MGTPERPGAESGPQGKDRLESTVRAVEETVQRASPAAAAGYTLTGAILGLGGLGYAIDYWRGTFPWFLMSGLLLGTVVGFYELIKATRSR